MVDCRTVEQDVNECSLKPAICTGIATCVNTLGSFLCQCPAGFRSVGTGCREFDECDKRNFTCSIDAHCTIENGTVPCVCKPGFTGDGFSCTDINECFLPSPPCDYKRCINEVGKYSCCQLGYRANRTIPGIEECTIQACPSVSSLRGTVTDITPLLKRLACLPGLEFPPGTPTLQYCDGQSLWPICEDINECNLKTHNCNSQSATCANIYGSYEHGFHLSKQEFRDGLALRYDWPLLDVPTKCAFGVLFSTAHAMCCPRGGFPTIRHNEVRDMVGELLTEVCHAVAIEPQLAPLSGEVFTAASTNTAEDARADVRARGFWTRAQDAFFDVRVFHPDAASYSAQPLDALLLQHERQKKLQYGERILIVDRGTFSPLVLSTSGVAAPECEMFLKRLCGLLARADSSMPYAHHVAYVRCRLSFALLRSAVMCVRGSRSAYHRPELNECEKRNFTCSSDAHCTNQTGTFSCVCKPGFIGDGFSCTDINECNLKTHNCSSQSATCANNYGSYVCECRPGFKTWNGTDCQELNECEKRNFACSSDAHCTNQTGTFSCVCKPGFTGDGFSCTDLKTPGRLNSTNLVAAIAGSIAAAVIVLIVVAFVVLRRRSRRSGNAEWRKPLAPLTGMLSTSMLLRSRMSPVQSERPRATSDTRTIVQRPPCQEAACSLTSEYTSGYVSKNAWDRGPSCGDDESSSETSRYASKAAQEKKSCEEEENFDETNRYASPKLIRKEYSC
ncbi:fibrillin-3-like [Sycon ciliatum]|uniref:fibrillin-3-like n=1 Tax=Sycon ciliatum TaxID=27933 RepID=UPI0031F68DFC